MGMHERSLPSAGLRRVRSALPIRYAPGQTRKGTPNCGGVARKRARRYLARRRLPKALWPILAALILIAIIFDRRIEPALSKALCRNGQAGSKPHAAEERREQEVHLLPSETGTALNGKAIQRYRPTTDFQAKHAAQIIAFLIRSRGKLDSDAVREKWKHLDRISMPLAVYLRDVEANDEWSALETEVATCPLPPESSTGLPDAPSSLRHRRILELTPEWLRRGEDLLNSAHPDEPTLTEELDHHPDDDPSRPKPARP